MEFFFVLLFSGLAVASVVYIAHFVYYYQWLQTQFRQARQQRKEVIDFLNHFSRSLATVADVDQAIQLVAHYLCDVLQAESLAIYTLDIDPADMRKKLRGSAVSGMFPAFDRMSDIVLSKEKYRLEHLRHEYVEIGEGIIGRTARDERSYLLADVAESGSGEQLPDRVETLMAAPMFVEKQLIGVICVINCKEESRRFNQDDLQMLENLSFQAAVSCNLVTIYSERNKQARILQELQLGREIQQSLLPKELPQWGEYSFSAFSRAALEVGGDYYDVVNVDEDRIMIVIADAAGKGVPACMLMSMCRSFVRSLVEHYTDLGKFLEHLNRRLHSDTDLAHFLTMALIVIDKKTHVCEYGSAGHVKLLLRLPSGQIRAVKPEGPALGLLPNEIGLNFETLSFCFPPGASLLLITDGITEALNSQEEEFGIERLQQVWERNQNASLSELTEIVLSEVQKFAGNVPQADDQTLFVVHRMH